MTAILKPWLCPGIEKEVRQILSWKARALSAPHPVENAPPYEDDDSNLRIQSSQVPKVVQVVKFLTFDDPVQAVISDKSTSITATIVSAAVEQFKQKYRRRITENTQGCLIQLLQFEIVATHLGRQNDLLTLRIQEFRHIGCDGEGTYGNPRQIMKQDGITQFLHELKDFRSRISAKRAELRNGHREGSLKSQEGIKEEEDHESEVVNSQLAFVTQRQHRKSAKAPSRSALGGRKVQNLEGFVTTEDTSSQTSRISSEEVEQNILSILKQAKEDELSCSRSSPTLTLAPSVKPRDGYANPLNHSELLALLERVDEGIVPPRVSNESGQKYMSKSSAISLSISGDHDVLGVQAGKDSKVVGMIKYGGNAAKSTLNKGLLLDNNQDNGTNEANELDYPDTAPRMVSKTTIGCQSHAHVSQKVDRPRMPLPLAGAFCEENEEDPWYGMLHIKKRDVTIPKNQQILLERRDCWLPPEPGSRGPVANIPVSILQTLTALAERDMDISSTDAVVQQDDPDCGSLQAPAEIPIPQSGPFNPQNSTREDEDLPISTAEWPPSSPPAMPKVDQLPSDTSLEGTPLLEGKVRKQTLRTDNPRSPSSNGRASVTSAGRISNFDMEIQIDSPVKSYSSISPKRLRLQQRRERKGGYDRNFNTESDPNFNDCHEIAVQTEREVSEYNAQSRIARATETDDEIEHGYAELNKSLYVTGNHQNITDLERSLGRLLPLDSDEETSSHRQASRFQPLHNDHDGTHLNTTKHHSKVPEEVTVVKDIEVAYSSSSELETSVPNALCERNLITYETMQRSTPMESTDSRQSTLQVHRTPYTNQDPRVKTRILPKKLVAENATKQDRKTEEVIRQNNISDNESIAEDIIPGTYSHLDNDQKLDIDHSNINFTENAEKTASIFHEGGVPYIIEEASVKMEKKNAEELAVGKLAGPIRVTKRGTEELPINSLNIGKRRKRTKPSKATMTEPQQWGETPETEAEQLYQDFLNNSNAQLRSSALFPDQVLKESVEKLQDTTPAEPILPRSSQYNRGLSAAQGMCETKTTCTQTPEATSSRSGTPCRDFQVTRAETVSLPKDESASLVQSMPNRRSSDLVDKSIFSTFREAYPAYQGNRKHFVAMCRKIQTLETNHRMEHKSLWDDFIIRHQMEYRAYLHECSEQADDPMSYETFYHSKIDEPQFSKRIITPGNLCEAISGSLQDGDLIVSTETSRLQGTEASYLGSPFARKLPSRDISPFLQNPSARQTTPLPRVSPLQRKSPFQQDSLSDSRLTPKQSTPRKPATWLSPILGTPRTTEKTPRSLPWKRKVPDDPFSSDQNPKRRIVSNVGVSSSEKPHHIQASTKSPAQHVTTSRRVYPATAHPRISAAMPTKATSISSNGTQKAARSSADSTTPQAARLPSIHATTASSRPTTTYTTSSSLPARKAAMPSHQIPQEPPAQPWYLDPVNPFRSFARADASIRNGNGNGFVDEKHQQWGRGTKAEIENGVVLTQMRRLDVLDWEL
ncbi:hypothetical protein MMC26_007299 [Xylographa opegraphella]|nr:hypothetical protein [Xylographa opegraphella]